jgi:hypothetical protein
VRRIPYFEALRCLQEADAILMPGSDDPSYSASKLMPCLFARKPMLVIFHEASPVVATMRELQAGTLITFRGNTSTAELAQRILEQWFQMGSEKSALVSHDRLGPHSARNMTACMVKVFDDAVTASHPELAPEAG